MLAVLRVEAGSRQAVCTRTFQLDILFWRRGKETESFKDSFPEFRSLNSYFTKMEIDGVKMVFIFNHNSRL